MSTPAPIDIHIELDELVDMIVHQAIDETIRFTCGLLNDTELSTLHELIVSGVVDAIRENPDILARAISAESLA